MRSHNLAVAALAALLVCAGAPMLSAHRLDEFLQAARIAVEGDRVDVELSLTPGTSVAESIIGDMDVDRDGLLSDDEQSAYARKVIDSLRLSIDGRAVPLAATGFTFPELAAFRRGDGIAQLRMSAAIRQTPGKHSLSFQNGNRRDVSVYLANALVPDSKNVDVTAQRRDGDQTSLAIDYVVRPQAEPPYWLFGSVGVAGCAIALTRRRGKRYSVACHP